MMMMMMMMMMIIIIHYLYSAMKSKIQRHFMHTVETLYNVYNGSSE